MFRSFKRLDEILRGDATQLSSLKDGQLPLPLGNLLFVIVLLGMVYGVCMGSFNLLHPLEEDAVVTIGQIWMQVVASALKFPLLFFLTLVVTFPSLYVFNALIGSRLNMVSVLKLLVASIAVILAVLASLGPIVIFFSLCTTSYSFMLLLNVAVCSVGGLLGLAFLLQTLHRLVLVQEQAAIINQPPRDLDGPADKLSTLGPAGPTPRKVKSVFRIWVFVFALVGAQMSWILRPFIGNPYLPFEWFRQRESNFFLAVGQAILNLLSLD